MKKNKKQNNKSFMKLKITQICNERQDKIRKGKCKHNPVNKGFDPMDF